MSTDKVGKFWVESSARGKPEVISSVPINALVLTGLANIRVVGNPETIEKRSSGKSTRAAESGSLALLRCLQKT
jgi:hypothetical protein